VIFVGLHNEEQEKEKQKKHNEQQIINIAQQSRISNERSDFAAR